ncbi:MAG TPA: bifunctional rhamnulose-1-phosphate aldolase/short-chain dehydrogenase [Terriglobales bacterium]|jgi:rhamnose utilization protein RhaD (predicted bifunctional aldolase and dehydrogenase)/NAD(P)-dependent dehydrogenase (short-subunit alcohol dehydrogenase family)
MQQKAAVVELKYLKDLWDEAATRGMDEPELLRYRSNLLGRDLRITNYGGGNTSSKITQTDPLSGEPKVALWVKGSGGDLGSIQRSGFAHLYLDQVRGLEKLYRGVEHEDDMVALYPLCAFGPGGAAPSIDTPLHAFLPFPHVDHLHPDWGIALAAAANGKAKMEEFNQKFGHRLVWVPWQRPGFELGLMIRQAVANVPGCDGIVLGGHGMFTWGETQRACYLNTLAMFDHLGQFVMAGVEKLGKNLFGGALHQARQDRRELALDLFPFLRGRVCGAQRLIGHFNDLPEVLQFAGAKDAPRFAHLGTSCPDHFLRTKIRPMLVDWNPATGTASEAMDQLRSAIDAGLEVYRREYAEYYQSFATPQSPAMRNANPSIVLVPGVGQFSFGKNKAEARIAGEFYVNAIHVMAGASGLADGKEPNPLPQAGAAAPTEAFKTHSNYVALPLKEAFGIEYWALEEAKLRRQPPEKEFSRKIVAIIGGGSGIGREAAVMIAARGAHVAVLDRDAAPAAETAAEVQAKSGRETAVSAAANIRERASVRAGLRAAVAAFGGIDVVIVTAAMFPSSPSGVIDDELWRATLDVNIMGSFLAADEARALFQEQNLPATLVLTSSANAAVPKHGSEAYDVSKAALSHLVRELAIGMAPGVRVNAIAPATVVSGSAMFPRDRVLASLAKYGIEHNVDESTDALRAKLAGFYARRTLTRAPITPAACAEAILFLAGERTSATTGHVIPVDGGLAEAFLR